MQPLSPTINLLPASSCARELLDAAPAFLWYVRSHMRRHRQGLSVPQFRALIKIRNEPAASLSEVAEHLGSSLPTASRIITTLVSRKYLVRTGCSHDRRLCRLSLSPRGIKVVEQALEASQSQMEAQLAHLSAEERSTVCAAMLILKNIFETVKQSESSGGEAELRTPRIPAPDDPQPRNRQTTSQTTPK